MRGPPEAARPVVVSRSRHQAPERRGICHTRPTGPPPHFCVIASSAHQTAGRVTACAELRQRHSPSCFVIASCEGPILRLVRIVRAASPLRRSGRIGMIRLIGPIGCAGLIVRTGCSRRFMTIRTKSQRVALPPCGQGLGPPRALQIGIEDSNAYERYVCRNAPLLATAAVSRALALSACSGCSVRKDEGRGCLPGHCGTARRCGLS